MPPVPACDVTADSRPDGLVGVFHSQVRGEDVPPLVTTEVALVTSNIIL